VIHVGVFPQLTDPISAGAPRIPLGFATELNSETVAPPVFNT